MSGITGAIDAALSGLNYFEAGINTVSENLANESTAGYATETASATTAVGAANQPGLGVSAPVITRAANSFATSLLNAATSAAQAASTQSTALTAISGALQNSGDVQSAINQFFDDVGVLASDPSSAGQAQTVLSDLQSVTSSFQSAAGTIGTTQTQTVATLSQNVTQANSLLGQLASINNSLTTAPNDPNLLDQQQAALNSLSGLLSVNVVTGASGQIQVNAGGSVLLDQAGAQSLTLAGGTAGTAPTITVGNSATTLSAGAQDGAIGAGIASWQAGAQALQSLNARASIFAAVINTAQAQGLTVAGAPGAALLSVPAPTVTPASTNTGAASLTAQITNGSQVPTDGGPFLLSYSTTAGWNAIDQSTGQSYAVGPGTTLAFAGLTVSVAGAPANGDRFIVNPSPESAASISVTTTNANAIAAADPYVATPGTLQSDGSILDDNAGQIAGGADSVTSTPAAGAAVVPASYYGQALQVTFTSPTSYNVSTAANPAVAIASGNLVNANGTIAVAYPAGAASGQYWQLPISGLPATGDTLTLTPGGSGSGSNAARLAALWTNASGTADGSLQSSFINLTTTLGANAQQATTQATNTAAQVTTATTNLQNVTGVSPDQQAVVLTTYQQAYQAAAQVISTAHSMFESLLQAVAP
jgi:flagellar hook-associated protein 1 FlgK